MSGTNRGLTHPAACLVVFFFGLAGGRLSAAQDSSAKKSDPELLAMEAKIDRFFERVSLGEVQNAYQDLLSGSRLREREKALKELVRKSSDLETKYGRFRDFERIAAKRIGRDLVLFRYLYKCEDFPVVWYFAFYRPLGPGESPSESSDWRVVTVRFDTELELLALK